MSVRPGRTLTDSVRTRAVPCGTRVTFCSLPGTTVPGFPVPPLRDWVSQGIGPPYSLESVLTRTPSRPFLDNRTRPRAETLARSAEFSAFYSRLEVNDYRSPRYNLVGLTPNREVNLHDSEARNFTPAVCDFSGRRSRRYFPSRSGRLCRHWERAVNSDRFTAGRGGFSRQPRLEGPRGGEFG